MKTPRCLRPASRVSVSTTEPGEGISVHPGQLLTSLELLRSRLGCLNIPQRLRKSVRSGHGHRFDAGG
eukprot:scaffold7346_cov245-Pinguiococcus_pyrenoidosus.AAC.7